MSGNKHSLKELLERLQKPAGLAPPTPAEADALMSGSEEADIDDRRLLDIADAVVRGKPIDIPTPEPESWSEHEQLSEAERKEFVLNRNRKKVNDEMKARADEAERKALSDEQDPDDKNELGRDGEPG